jgi:hypothetical protein
MIISKNARTALILFLSFLLLYGLTARSTMQVSDEAAVFATSMSLVNRGTLAIDQLKGLQAVVNVGGIGVDGHLFAKYYPGNVLGAAILYQLTARPNDQPFIWHDVFMSASDSGARLALKLNALLGALTIAGLFLVVAQDYSLRTALLTAVLFGISTDWWYQARGFFSEIGAGTFLILSLYFARKRRPYASSAMFAISLLFRPLNLLAAPIWLYAVWRSGRKVLVSALIVVFAGLFLAAYNQIRFGSPFDFGYGEETFSTPFFTGLYGILLSPGRSLFLYSPVLVLAIPGAVMLRRIDRSLLYACLSTIPIYMVSVALWHAWDGGWSWGSRLLTPIVPLLGVLIAPVIDRAWANRNLALLVGLLAFIGVSIQLIALARDPMVVLLNGVFSGTVSYDEFLYSPTRNWLVLQARSLSTWRPCDIDAYHLRLLLCHG